MTWAFSLNGVLRQKIRIQVASPISTAICVDDKHAYVNMWTDLFILEKVHPAVVGSSA